MKRWTCHCLSVFWLKRLTFTISGPFHFFLAYSFNANSRQVSIHLRLGSLVFSSVFSKTVNRKKGADKLTFRSKRSCTNCDTDRPHWKISLHQTGQLGVAWRISRTSLCMSSSLSSSFAYLASARSGPILNFLGGGYGGSCGRGLLPRLPDL